jgi:hypothetical protein
MSLEKVGVLVTGNQNTGQTQKTKTFCGHNPARKTPSFRWLLNSYASAQLSATAFRIRASILVRP